MTATASLFTSMCTLADVIVIIVFRTLHLVLAFAVVSVQLLKLHDRLRQLCGCGCVGPVAEVSVASEWRVGGGVSEPSESNGGDATTVGANARSPLAH